MIDLNELPDVESSSSSVDLNSLPDVKPTKHMSTFEAGVTSFNAGVERFTNSVLAGGAYVLDKSGLTKNLSAKAEKVEAQRLKDKAEAYAAAPMTSNVGEFLGTLVATAPTAVVTGGASLLGKVAATAATSAGAGFLAMPEGEESRLSQARDWGLAGAAGGALIHGVGSLLKTGKSALGGLVKEDAEALMQKAEAAGMPIALENIMKKSTLKNFTRSVVDNIPFSKTAGLHEAQQARVEPIIKGMIYKLAGAGDDDAMDTILSGANTTKVFDSMKTRAKSVVDDAYNEVATVAEKLKSNVNIKSFKDEVAAKIEEFKGQPNASSLKPLINKLSAYTKYPDEVPFKTARMIRSVMGKEYADAERGLTTGSSFAKEGFGLGEKNIINALDTWGTNPENGSVFTTYMKANGLYEPYVNVFKNPQIKAAMKDAASMYSYVGTLIKDRNPEHLGKALKYMDNAEVNLVKARQIKEALDGSYFRENGVNMVDPRKFVNFLTDTKKAQKTLWGSKLDETEGLTKFLEAYAPSKERPPLVGTSVTDSAVKIVAQTLSTPLSAFTGALSSPKLAKIFLRWKNLTSAAPANVVEGMKRFTVNELKKASKLNPSLNGLISTIDSNVSGESNQ